MTTVLADAHEGIMVADTAASGGDRQWPNARKVWRSRGALLGFAGLYEEIEVFLAWWRAGQPTPAPRVSGISVLALSAQGLHLYVGGTRPITVTGGREAIGSGDKAAMCAYEALGWAEPRRAVLLACKYDSCSRAPVRSYRL